MLVAGMSSEEIQFVAENSHGVGISRHRDHSRDLRLNPSHRVEIENINVIEAFVSVVPTEHVEFPSNS